MTDGGSAGAREPRLKRPSWLKRPTWLRIPEPVRNRLGPFFRSLDPVDHRADRIAFAIAAIASVWFALAAFWEIDKPIGAGHWAAVGARGIIAENMDTWSTIAPIREYHLSEPSPKLWYANHPWGTFWVTSLLYQVFGRHDFVCRLPAVLMACACPPLIFAIGKRLWGSVAGAVAAAGYAVLPMALGFANFNGFEGAVVFGSLLTSWATLRFVATWQRRWMVVALGALLFTCHTDWVVNVFVGSMLALLMLTQLLLPEKWFGPINNRRFAQWWALGVCVAAGSLLFYVLLLRKAGYLGGLLQQAKMRSSGSSAPLDKVLEARSYWIALTFTPLAIFIGKLGLPLIVVRWLAMRRAYEVFALAIFVTATVHYVGFKQGADIHIYWSQIYAPYFALALGAVTVSFDATLRRVIRAIRRGKDSVLVAPLVSLGLLLLVPLFILPDGVRALSYSRNSGGRFDEKGRVIHADVDKQVALRFLRPKLEKNVEVQLHKSFKPDWAQLWSLQRDTKPITRLPNNRLTGKHRYVMTDMRYLHGSEMRSLTKRYAVTAIGPFWLVDMEAPKKPLEVHSIERTKPGFFGWYFVWGTDPEYSVGENEFRRWELRHHFDHEPNPPPAGEPKSLEEVRIAHNLAVLRRDALLIAKYRKRLEEELKLINLRFSDSSVLLGRRFDQTGSVARLELYFVAPGPSKNELQFSLRARVEEKASLSLVPADDRERHVGLPFALPPSLWKEGYIYAKHSEIRKRPGRERFYGFYYSRNGGKTPRPERGPIEVPLLEIE